MCVKLRSVCVKLHSVCVKLHTVCEITQCAQSYTYSIGEKNSQLKNFTLTPWAAWATNISCGCSCNKSLTNWVTINQKQNCSFLQQNSKLFDQSLWLHCKNYASRLQRNAFLDGSCSFFTILRKGQFVFTGLFLFGFLSIFCESLQWPITFISWQMGGTRNQENFGKYKFVRFLQSPQQFSFVF